MEPPLEEGLLILSQILKLFNWTLQKLKNNAFQVIMTSPEISEARPSQNRDSFMCETSTKVLDQRSTLVQARGIKSTETRAQKVLSHHCLICSTGDVTNEMHQTLWSNLCTQYSNS